MLTVNSLVAADSVLIPMQCEYYALEGLSALIGTIDQIRSAVNDSLELEGILRTMFDPRNNLANEVSAQLIMHFGDKVFRTIIPRNIRLAEAPSFGKPVLFHDRESRGALAYLALAGEMIRREEEEREQAAAALASQASAATAAPAVDVSPTASSEAVPPETGASASAEIDPAEVAPDVDVTATVAAEVAPTHTVDNGAGSPQMIDSAAPSEEKRPSEDLPDEHAFSKPAAAH
jgi:hypothetical protein